MSAESREVAQGLAKVAHAIRRTGALYIAAIMLPEGTSDEELFERADTMATWILGRAGVAEGRASEPLLGQDVNFND